jgi:hypothetical protein
MEVCAARVPLEEELDGERRVLCWLHTSDERVGAVDRRPLEREELAVAEEA